MLRRGEGGKWEQKPRKNKIFLRKRGPFSSFFLLKNFFCDELLTGVLQESDGAVYMCRVK